MFLYSGKKVLGTKHKTNRKLYIQYDPIGKDTERRRMKCVLIVFVSEWWYYMRLYFFFIVFCIYIFSYKKHVKNVIFKGLISWDQNLKTLYTSLPS